MSTKNGLNLTPEVIAGWREESKKHRDQSLKHQKIADELERRANAADVVLGAGSTEIPPPADEGESVIQDSDEEGDSVADRLLADMRKSGQSLKVKQVKARLIELGFGELLKTKPTYVYGLVYRLTKSTKLLKRGSKYRAAPTDSSQEETGAVGAPVRH